MKKKLIVIAVALVAIAIIAYFGIGFGTDVIDKSRYGTEMADLSNYFGVSGDELAIILQDARVEDNALLKDGTCYFAKSTVDEYLGEGFYYDPTYNGGVLMFTTTEGTYETVVGSSYYSYKDEPTSTGYTVAFLENEQIYIAGDFLKNFYTFTYEAFDLHVQMYTEWSSYTAMTVEKDTQIRYQGGTQSPILREVKEGETVELLDQMETWSKVKTSDSFIGYIENKKLSDAGTVTEKSPAKVTLPEHNNLLLDTKVCMGFHSIAGTSGNDTIYEATSNASGMNVIAPTWFSLSDDEGNIRSFGSTDYVSTAHSMGYQVWAVLDDFNYQNDNGVNISNEAILSNTVSRRMLISNVVNTAVSLGVDGINLDFEDLSSETGDDYAQFLKELSVLCSERGLVLSADNYVPYNFNSFYHLDVQGKYLDYVMIMGYDEHYHGSGDIGSVASIDYVTYGIQKTMQYVEPKQIVNILPFYTIVWKDEGGTVTDSYLTLVNQADYISRLGIATEWDEETCQNYAEWKSNGATYYLWCEDNQSIVKKLNVMDANDLGGVAVWRLGYGTKEVWNTLAVYAEN